jgi:hypothetical protein
VQRATLPRSPDFFALRRAPATVLHCAPDMATVGAAFISENRGGSSPGVFNPARLTISLDS